MEWSLGDTPGVWRGARGGFDRTSRSPLSSPPSECRLSESSALSSGLEWLEYGPKKQPKYLLGHRHQNGIWKIPNLTRPQAASMRGHKNTTNTVEHNSASARLMCNRPLEVPAHAKWGEEPDDVGVVELHDEDVAALWSAAVLLRGIVLSVRPVENLPHRARATGPELLVLLVQLGVDVRRVLPCGQVFARPKGGRHSWGDLEGGAHVWGQGIK